MTGYWAADGVISQAPLPGGVEITAEQYADALAGIMEGRRVVLRDGLMEVVTPEPDAEPEQPPPPPPPTTEELRAQTRVSAFQARAALALTPQPDAEGQTLLDAAEAWIATAGPVERLAWEYAVEFRRLSPTILAAQAALVLTDEQVDQLFALAATIEA